jgi:cell division protein FtsB
MKVDAPGRNKYQANRRQPAADLLSGLRLLQCLSGILLVLVLLVTYGILFSSHGILRYRQQRQQLQEMEAKVENSREENQRLFNRVQSLKNDPVAQERLVREQLGWVRENELVFEFLPSKSKDR